MSAPNLGPSPTQITTMGRHIVAAIAEQRSRRKRRRRVAIAAAAVALGLGVAAAAVGVARAPQQLQDTAFSCFFVDDARSTVHVVQTFDDVGDPTPAERVRLALDTCQIVFGQDGVVTPRPTACELPDLRLAVFPNLERLDVAELCAKVGLAVPDGADD